MKYILLSLMVFPLVASAQNDGFLSKSKLLSEAGIKITPAQIFDKNKVLPIFASDSPVPLFLIGEDGVERLDKIKNAKKVKLKIRTCGADEMASPWLSKSKNAEDRIFIASGKNVENLKIKWTPAKQIKTTVKPDGILYGKGYELTSFYVAEINGLKEQVFYSENKSPQLLKYEKEYKAQKNHESSPPKIDCSKADLAYQKIGLLDGTKPKILLESPINCEGQGYKQGSFSNPLGLIEISDGKTNEKWLIFMAYGYEGDAFLGLKLNEDKPPKEDTDIDFYIYSGC